MKERKDCEHENLMFGSGDYYIFCTECPAKWVVAGNNSDENSPQESNIGVGAGLSGERRVRQK